MEPWAARWAGALLVNGFLPPPATSPWSSRACPDERPAERRQPAHHGMLVGTPSRTGRTTVPGPSARRHDDVNVTYRRGHDHRTLHGGANQTTPFFGPGIAPLMSSRPFSVSTAWIAVVLNSNDGCHSCGRHAQVLEDAARGRASADGGCGGCGAHRGRRNTGEAVTLITPAKPCPLRCWNDGLASLVAASSS